MLKIFSVLIILCLALGFNVGGACAFNLPKLKIIYIKPAPPLSRIHGSTKGLPVISVDFVKTPLWKALQKISNKTGYMFTSKRVNLGKEVTLKGKYNFASLLNKLFEKDTVRINTETKKVNIEGK